MATADATRGSSSIGWGKGVAAICGSRLHTHEVYPDSAPQRVKTYVLPWFLLLSVEITMAVSPEQDVESHLWGV